MAKKSFKENPALSFITQAIAENAPAEARTEPTDTDNHTHTSTYDDVSVFESMHTDTYTVTDTNADVDTDRYAPEPAPEAVPKKKPPVKRRPADAPALMERGESKSKRLQLLLRPSTHDGIARLAKQYNTSVNDIINQVLENYLLGQQEP